MCLLSNLIVASKSKHCPFFLRCQLMETAATAAPAWGFFSSFLLLAFGTLVAALLGAAHRLGLFYQLMHKVRGHTGVAGRGQSKEWTSVSAVSS